MGSLRSVIYSSIGLAGIVGSGVSAPWAVAQSPAAPPLTPQPSTAPTAEPEFEFRGGRWIPLTDLAPTTLPTDATLDRCEEYLQRNGWRAARKLVLRWFKTHGPRDPLRDRATFILAECYYQSGNRILAFYHYDEVMDLYPDSRLYRAALQRQYDIADAYLRGYKSRFLYMPILGMQDEAIEMLFRIQGRAPGSPIAERSLLRSADYYYATSQFDLAADAYGSYITSYPRSPLIGRVKLRQAFSKLALFRGTRFDATPIIDARELLSDLIVTEPAISQQENIPAVIGRIDDAQALKLLQTGIWYQRTRNFRGATYIYRLLIEQFAESPHAADAKVRLTSIPEQFLSDPVPQNTRETEMLETGIGAPDLSTPSTRPDPSAAPTTAPSRVQSP